MNTVVVGGKVLSAWPRMPIRMGTRSRMGAGAMADSAVSSAAFSEVRRNAGLAISGLASQLELASMEGALLSPSVLDEDPSASEAISLAVGFTVPQLRTLVYSDALAISGLASGMKAGALSSYLTSDQKRDLDAIVSKCATVGAQVKATGLMSQLPESLKRASEDHNAMHTDEVINLIREAEKAVVSAEAGVGGSVPVLEPYERDEMTKKVILASVAAAVIAAVIYFS